MTRRNSLKINSLLKRIPRGMVLTPCLLKAKGISSKLAWWYVQSGWLARIDRGIYKLAGDSITWAGVLSTLSSEYPTVHLGGKTALQVLGKSHYIAVNFIKQKLQLFSPAGVKLPRWVNTHSLEEKFQLHATSLFSGLEDEKLSLLNHKHDNLSIQVSAPERAALEVCYLVPKVINFQEAALLIENLLRLRPQLVQTLLESCQSIKVKRLFLYLSEYYQHTWLSELDLTKIELGKGKQLIAGGGVYDAKYKISVPNLGDGS
ncbi:MAG: type IV toxin-antitoxin system AbiEi family antitoxin domain-containing protein [Pseudomonadota bacterium]